MQEPQVVQEIVAYRPYKAQLAELEKTNKETVFDYRSKQGNKEARSHIHGLRKVKAEVDRVRKAEKEASIAYGKKVDAEAKEIISKLEEMIEVHQVPIEEIEKQEKDRVQGHRNAIDEIFASRSRLGVMGQKLNSSELKLKLESLEKFADRDFEEFGGEANEVMIATKIALVDAIKEVEVEEKEKAELARLREEARLREIKEKEEVIAREAAEKARLNEERKKREEIEALERKAKAEKEALETRARLESEKAEREKREADERLKRAEAEKIAAEKRAVEAERFAKEKAEREQREKIEKEKAAQAKREADKAHRERVMTDAVLSMKALGLDTETANGVIEWIAEGRIKNVKIVF